MKHVLYVLVAMALLVSGSRATVVLRLDLPGLVERSEIIALGRCLSARSSLDAAGRITTTLELLVEDGLRGASVGGLLRLTLPGGEVEGLGMVVPGLPIPRPDDEVLIFLTPESPAGLRVPVGLAQGVWRVERDPLSGARQVRRSLGALQLLDPVTGEATPGTDDAPIPLPVLRAAVGRLLEPGR